MLAATLALVAAASALRVRDHGPAWAGLARRQLLEHAAGLLHPRRPNRWAAGDDRQHRIDCLERLRTCLPGQWRQAKAGGLHQNWFRDYDPSLGRYIEADASTRSGSRSGRARWRWASAR